MTIERTLETIVGRGNVAEIRALNVDGRGNRTDRGYFDDFKLAAAAVNHYENGRPFAKGLYLVLNTINPALIARGRNKVEEWTKLTTTDKDVTGRRWLYVDMDPKRPSGISSSEPERLLAMDKAEQVRDWMLTRGAFEPITAMSGNGAHLLFPVDLPNTPEILDIYKRVLAGLAAMFSDEAVDVDESVCNAARICRLYGTTARKGDNDSVRPHRVSKMVHVPDYLDPAADAWEGMTPADLERIARELDQLATPPASTVGRVHPPAGGHMENHVLIVPAYLQRHGIEFRECHAGGIRKYQMDCPFDSNHKRPDAYCATMESGASVFHCSHDSCKDHKWQQLRTLLGDPLPDEFDPPKQARPAGHVTSKSTPAPTPAIDPKGQDAKPKPAEAPEAPDVAMSELAARFAASVGEPGAELFELGVSDIDRALGGGIAAGEMLIVAGRPNHGKSMVGLQCLANLTAAGISTAFMSEDMTERAVSQKAVQYATALSMDQWADNQGQLQHVVEQHYKHRAACWYRPPNVTVDKLIADMTRLYETKGVQVFCLDYIQQIRGAGKEKTAQVTDTSQRLREFIGATGATVIALAQLKRGIETRTGYHPTLSDIKDSGQIEQDADVVLALVHPHKFNSQLPVEEFTIYQLKNRARETVYSSIRCVFDGARQRLNPPAPAHADLDNAFR